MIISIETALEAVLVEGRRVPPQESARGAPHVFFVYSWHSGRYDKTDFDLTLAGRSS